MGLSFRDKLDEDECCMGARVFVRLYDSVRGFETDDEVVALPAPPLSWQSVLRTAIGAVWKEDVTDHMIDKAKLYLLPFDTQDLCAEVTSRSLRQGIRENDRLVVCLNGEKYTPPAKRDALDRSPSTNSQPSPRNDASEGSPNASSAGRRGTKRSRSVSGKMAVMKIMRDKGLISNESFVKLKDILLNEKSMELQEALDRYNTTGDFEPVNQILMRQIRVPHSKRNAGDVLSETFTLAFSQPPPSETAEKATVNLPDRFPLTSPSPYAYATSQSAANPTVKSTSQLHPRDQPSRSYQVEGHPMDANGNYGYNPSAPPPYQQQMQDPSAYHNMPDQRFDMSRINMPMRNRDAMVRRNMTQMDMYHPQQAYGYGYGGYPAMHMADPNMNMQHMGYHPSYYPPAGIPMNAMGMQHQYEYYPGYGSTMPPPHPNPMTGAAAASGKWVAPPMPSYPGACSKEEKRVKIARWLKKREKRNWSTKPSYPVRHSIAKNRVRGEDGRFIPKAKLAEMAAKAAAEQAGKENTEDTPMPTEVKAGT